MGVSETDTSYCTLSEKRSCLVQCVNTLINEKNNKVESIFYVQTFLFKSREWQNLS